MKDPLLFYSTRPTIHGFIFYLNTKNKVLMTYFSILDCLWFLGYFYPLHLENEQNYLSDKMLSIIQIDFV